MENVVGILMFADSLVIKKSMEAFIQGGFQVRYTQWALSLC